MGTLNTQGALCGKIGPVVAATWNGINYLRSLPQHFKDKKSKKQLRQRSKFTQVLRVLQSMKEYIRVGFKPMAYHQSAFNAAMSHNLQNAPVCRNGKVEMDFSRLCVSFGGLNNAFNMQVHRELGKLVVTWTDNSGIGSAKKKDTARLLIYNIGKGQSVWAESVRCAQCLEMALPHSWAGDKLAVYMSFASEDGKEVSVSSYLGIIKAFELLEEKSSDEIQAADELFSYSINKEYFGPSSIPKKMNVVG